jgi:PAS domain-containing protein
MLTTTSQVRYRAHPVSGEAVLVLDDAGIICGCDDAAEALLKYCRVELINRHVSLLLPELREGEFMRDGKLSPRIRFLCHIGHRFRVITKDGQCFFGELFLNCLPDASSIGIRVVV